MLQAAWASQARQLTRSQNPPNGTKFNVVQATNHDPDFEDSNRERSVPKEAATESLEASQDHEGLKLLVHAVLS
jgi:hypothetical protein